MLFLDCKLAPSPTDRSGTWDCGCYLLGQSGPEATSVANQIHDCSSSIRNLYFLPPWPISKHCRIIEGLPTSLNPPPQFSSPSCKPWRCRVCYRASEGNFPSRAFWHQSTMAILYLDTNHPQTNHLWLFLGSGFSKKNWVYKEVGLFLTILSLFLRCSLHTNFDFQAAAHFLSNHESKFLPSSCSCPLLPIPGAMLLGIALRRHFTSWLARLPRFLRVLPESYSFYLPENHASWGHRLATQCTSKFFTYHSFVNLTSS